MSRPFAPCGTETAYRWHKRRGEEPCEACAAVGRASSRGRRRPPAANSGSYVEGWRDRYCTLCDFGPACRLGSHYRRRHGVDYRSLGLTKEDVNSAEYLDGLRGIAADMGAVPDRVTREYSPVANVRHRSRDRRRRWAAAAVEELKRGPGYRARLARRWGVSPDDASGRLYLLRRQGLIPKHDPARCGTPGGYQRHWRAGEEPCDACREANQAYRRAAYKRRRQINPDRERQRYRARSGVINAQRRQRYADDPEYRERRAGQRQRRAERHQEAAR